MSSSLHGTISCFLVVVAAIAAGCSGSDATRSSLDEEFGHRYDGRAPDGRDTFVISPPDSAFEYMYHPAVFDTVTVRPGRLGAGETTPTEVRVDVLVKGYFPDGCSALHALEQRRTENIISVTLTMRRPRRVLCASVVRPYRFYLELEGMYERGNYTLKLNEKAIPFVVRDRRG